ncbi:MAG: YbaB/EbfC family nucleoid-associated protein [Firmicutes bacterium]|nr:YbaB/EbfC family nucleoid-associated protein [Bacillota bacterium]
MNMQALMKQAQKIQNDMMKAKEEINNTVYCASSSIVSVKINGEKKVLEVKIDAEQLDKDDIDMLSDMIMVAINEANKQVDKDTESKLGKYTQGMPGLF